MAPAVAVAPTARPDRFAAWLAGQGAKLQTAYAGLIGTAGASANHLAPAVAERIIRHVAGRPALESLLYTTRHTIGTTNEAVKNKANYSYKQLATAFGRAFR